MSPINQLPFESSLYECINDGRLSYGPDEVDEVMFARPVFSSLTDLTFVQLGFNMF